jgi:hypothetical protein
MVQIAKYSVLNGTRFQVQNVTMKLRGGILSSGLRWSREQDDISRNTNRQVRRLSIMYYTVGVTAVLSIIAVSLHDNYRQMSGADNRADGDAAMVNSNAEIYPLSAESICECSEATGRDAEVSRENTFLLDGTSCLW